jgi:hypothetical protein
MWYLALIVVFIIIIKWVEKNAFHWETIIKYLWKELYKKADMLSVLIHSNTNLISDMSKKYEKPIVIIGSLINSILDFVNYFNQEKDEDVEEETFGYGRFDFKSILNTAKTNPNAFKKLI